MSDQIEDDATALRLAWTLLSEDRTRITLREVAPDPSPTDIGARAGFGAVAQGIDLRLNAYVFGEWGEGADHAAQLRQTLGGPDRQVRSAVNGRLLLVASAGPGDQEEFTIEDVCSAFTGRE
jgi:hypothetical protein